MKKIKSNILVFAFLAMGTFAGITSCDKDPVDGGGAKTYENVEGVYAGTHFLDIPANILKVLSDNLPVDTVTGLPTDLTKGFEDTLDVRVVNNVVKVTSSLLGITVDGSLTANNTIKIDETKYDELNLGTTVKAEKASLATKSVVTFNSKEIGSSTPVELRLKAEKIAGFAIPLNITTKKISVFTRIAN